jgi:hypothetical protein
MSTRQRMTWAALDREAAAPPAIPGYGVEDQDHPAHTQDDPGKDDYNIGGPSEFAEDVHPGPYGDSGPPALPGVGVEDQDHPAHKGQVGRNASLMELVRRKSAKALVLAKATLGKTASWDNIEDQAYGYMSMDDGALDASIGRLGGDFLGMEEELMGMFPEEDMGMDDVGMDEPSMDPMEARLKAMEEELFAMRAAADQNDPDGETLGAKGKSEDQEKKEEAAANKEARSAPFLAMFDAYDTDNDGFVTAEDWGGPRAMFASLDTDKDGIIARHEVQAGCEKMDNPAMEAACEAKKKKAGDDEDEEGDKKASDDEDEDDKGKEASKLAFGHEADFDEDELEMLSAMQFDEAPEDEIMGCGDVMASDKNAKKGDDDDEDDKGSDKEAKKSDDDGDDDEGGDDEGGDDDDDEGSDKEASGDAEFFAQGFDPMGLSDGTTLTAADKAAFNEVFGSGDDDADEDEGSDKEASLASLLQPQKRTASKGVKSVGNVPKVASKKANEVEELSSLWASDPDVSGSFS